MTSRRFLFPGERGAVVPEAGRHDFLHVVSGYDTDGAGETEVTAFDAGLAKLEDPFGLLFGTLCMFHLGQKLRGEKGAPAINRPHFDAERVGRAYRRGLLAEADLGAGWDFWADVERPLEELRRQYNIHIA
jgi:ubiquinone biosynthesis protein Coq4